jgi:pimeloyl-ACP methyl ester carboxylesterase
LGDQLVINGRTLHFECIGTGSPTVVLQSGFGNAGDVWSLSETAAPAVEPELAKTNRVFSYDRPGSQITTTTRDGVVVPADAAQRGRSDAVPMPRPLTEVVTELHDLLAAAAVPGPYVMVGHSLGGVLGLLYARWYPDEVCALVSVDAPLPALRGLITADHVRRMAFDPSEMPGYTIERYDLNELFDEIEVAKPLPALPVVVVRRGKARFGDGPVAEGSPLTQGEIDTINDGTWKAQSLWAESVPGAELVTVPDTTHYVFTERPDAVVAAIHDAIIRI